MSKHVDIDQLERDMGDGGGEYVNIHYSDLINLIERVRAGEQLRSEITEVAKSFCFVS